MATKRLGGGQALLNTQNLRGLITNGDKSKGLILFHTYAKGYLLIQWYRLALVGGNLQVLYVGLLN